jgi:hypothetical protein
MIVYDLICDQEHRFEGWFGSATDFERQSRQELLSCPVCGSSHVSRLPSAAYIKTDILHRTDPSLPGGKEAGQEVEAGNARLFARLIEHVLQQTEDVGSKFAEEARRIHYREAEPRNIRGSSTLQDVKELIEEGIEVFPLPVAPVDKLH